MPQFIRMPGEKKKRLIAIAKQNAGCSWTKLGKKVNCSRGMIFAYQKRVAIPLAVFQKLCKVACTTPDQSEYETIEINNRPRKVTTPKKTSAELSEFLGILAGDGHVSKLKYPIQIICHRWQDREYLLKRVVPLMRKLFETEPMIRELKTVIYCRISSKPLVEYLNREFGIPLGKKKMRLRIPKAMFRNPEHLAAYLRGLFDTDGSVYPRREKDIAMDITSASPEFCRDINKALETLGLHPVINGKNVQLYRKSEIKKFFTEVKPANNKHLIKYQARIKTGKIRKAIKACAVVV